MVGAVNVVGLAKRVATALGSGWAYVPPLEGIGNCSWALLRQNIGNVVELGVHAITYGSQQGRLEICGVYPRGPEGEYLDPYASKAPKITVSSDRDPAHIAIDINRRLLPRVVELTDKCRQEAARRAEHLDGCREAQCMMAAALGMEKPPAPQRHMRATVDPYTLPELSESPIYGKFLVNGPNSIAIDFSGLPLSVACAMATAMINALKGGTDADD